MDTKLGKFQNICDTTANENRNRNRILQIHSITGFRYCFWFVKGLPKSKRCSQGSPGCGCSGESQSQACGVLDFL